MSINSINLIEIFHSFFDPVNHYILLIDSSDKIIKANKKALEGLDITKNSLIHDLFKIDLVNKIAISTNNKNDKFTLKIVPIENGLNLYHLIPVTLTKNDYEKIISEMPIGILIFDKNGNPIYYNKTFLYLWGLEPSELNDYNIFYDEKLISTGVIDQIKKVFKGKPYLFLEGYYDSLLEKGKGFKIWVESTILPIKDFNDEVKFVVILHKDISEVKLAQEEIKIARDAAEEANRLKNAFLANLSHEIRTPLNAILGFSDLIADIVSDKLDESDKVLLNNFKLGSKRLFRTLTQILELSQIDTGNYQIVIEPLNLKYEIQKVIDEYIDEAKSKNIDININLDENHLIVLADKPALNRILSNLIENAIKFTNKGYIKIETYPNKNQNILFCSIKDTGIGISEEYLDHIFEPFSQEEDGFNRPFEGSGLGLALTKKYINLINSSITVDSVKGVGSTFTFTLPIFRG